MFGQITYLNFPHTSKCHSRELTWLLIWMGFHIEVPIDTYQGGTVTHRLTKKRITWAITSFPLDSKIISKLNQFRYFWPIFGSQRFIWGTRQKPLVLGLFALSCLKLPLKKAHTISLSVTFLLSVFKCGEQIRADILSNNMLLDI